MSVAKVICDNFVHNQNLCNNCQSSDIEIKQLKAIVME